MKIKRHKNKISFDEEIITKDRATELLLEEKKLNTNDNTVSSFTEPKSKKAKKRSKNTIDESLNKLSNKRKEYTSKNDEINPAKRNKNETEDNNTSEDTTASGQDETPGTKKNKESIRSQKKKKHAKLLEEKKVKTELSLQQKALNYLSKWKHSKSEWKFEKLRQIWLSENLFDNSKIPNEFWETTIQYFSGSKGQTRKLILDNAINIVDKEDTENTDENYQLKLSRARDLIQNLQE